MADRVSIVIKAFNEEAHVAQAIRSALAALEPLQGQGEVILADSASTDRTVEIASGYPVKILQREYFGSAAQKNWSLDHIRSDWVLILDADERVTPALAHEILGLLCTEPKFNGYFIRRENVMLNHVIRHSGWSTDKVIRLFHRARGRYPNRRVHADLDIEGPIPTLKHPLTHFTYRNFDQYFEKFLNYAEWGAAQGLREGRSAGYLEIAVRPVWRFFRTFVLQAGFLDGLHGLAVCGLQSFGVFLKYFRLWEYRERLKAGEDLDLPAFDDDQRTWSRPDE